MRRVGLVARGFTLKRPNRMGQAPRLGLARHCSSRLFVCDKRSCCNGGCLHTVMSFSVFAGQIFAGPALRDQSPNLPHAITPERLQAAAETIHCTLELFLDFVSDRDGRRRRLPPPQLDGQPAVQAGAADDQLCPKAIFGPTRQRHDLGTPALAKLERKQAEPGSERAAEEEGPD